VYEDRHQYKISILTTFGKVIVGNCLRRLFLAAIRSGAPEILRANVVLHIILVVGTVQVPLRASFIRLKRKTIVSLKLFLEHQDILTGIPSVLRFSSSAHKVCIGF